MSNLLHKANDITFSDHFHCTGSSIIDDNVGNTNSQAIINKSFFRLISVNLAKSVIIKDNVEELSYGSLPRES